MNPALIFRSSTLVAILAAALSAHATLLDFEELTGGTYGGDHVTVHGSPVLSKGFSFASVDGLGNPSGSGYTSFDADTPSNSGFGYNYTGSLALGPQGGVTLFTKVDGGAFNLLSMDIANLYRQTPMPSNGPINFVGTHADGSTVTMTYTTTLDDNLHAVTFSDFNDLVSVSWGQGYPYHQFDNVNVQAVPEPATLVALGLGAVGLFRKRRR